MMLFRLVHSLFNNAGLVFTMALQQVRRRYVGTLGGIGWALLQPLTLIVTYWVVFALGFRVKIGDGTVSFTAYFITGTAAWLLMSEAVSACVGSITGSAYLVKKVVFPVEALPVAPVISSAILHLFLLAVVLGFLLIDRGTLPWTALLVPYYTCCALILCLGIAFLTSALQVFFRDVQKLVDTALGVWFWLTPVVWPVDLVPAAWRPLLSLNPAWYIVQGYRNSLIEGIPPWDHPAASAIFWVGCIAAIAVGAWVFERLKPEFAEVL
jgi:lipopolysaccharide transport system permease protein/teichoic acid transport system permease protein